MKNRALIATYEGLLVAAEQYVAEKHPQVESPESAAGLLRPLAKGATQESFWVLLLNAKHHVTKIHLVTLGLADRSQVHAREVFRQAIVGNAHSVILAHNRPSGDPTPSAQDIGATRSLIEAGKIIGIEALGHVVLGCRTGSDHSSGLSFREENLL